MSRQVGGVNTREMRQVGAVEEGQDCRDSPGRTEAHVGSDGNNKRMKVNREKRGKGERSVRQFYKTFILTQQNSMKLQSRTPTNIQNSEIAAGLTLKPQITAVGLLFLLHYCLVSGHLERYEKPESVKFPDPPPYSSSPLKHLNASVESLEMACLPREFQTLH